MSLLNTMNISASALTAQRFRMDIITNNLANVETTRGADGNPYRRQQIVFEERALETRQSSFGSQLRQSMTMRRTREPHAWGITGRSGFGGGRLKVGGGVQVAAIVPDESEFRRVYDPGHPDADAEGYVSYPNVNSIIEMVDMISATRAYEASVAAHNAARSMALKALEIGR
ncbi:MAG: flagellar basal body rod protein FlgC [Symbiobacteriaceae bacterium]|nr:flagellar basal body rod protein FlgC [Symbiobacteriaceae bacterium]